MLLSDIELGGHEDQRSLQAADKPCGVPGAGFIILRLLETVPSSLRNGGWALSTLGLFIVGPALGGERWDQPWAVLAAVKGLPWSLRVLSTVPPSGVCDGNSEIYSEVNGPCPI